MGYVTPTFPPPSQGAPARPEPLVASCRGCGLAYAWVPHERPEAYCRECNSPLDAPRAAESWVEFCLVLTAELVSLEAAERNHR